MTQVVKGLETVIGGLRKRAAGDLRKTHEIVIGCAHIGLRHIRPLVPVEYGDLLASGHIEAGLQGFFSNASIVFGGVAPSGRLVDYAVYVNEDTEKYHEPPTGAKFMERGLRDAMPEMKAFVGAAFTSSGRQIVDREVDV